MFRHNVIWVDFRLSKNIRKNQVISFMQWMKARAGRRHSNDHASRSALEIVRLMLERKAHNGGPRDKASASKNAPTSWTPAPSRATVDQSQFAKLASGMNARKVTCACARRFPRHGFKPPLLIWIELELLDRLAVQSPVATSRAAQIDLDRMIEWNRARTCEQVLPCLHPVEAIRRLFRISDNRASRLDPQPAIFPGWTAPVIRKAEDGERELLRCRGVSCSYSRARLPAGSSTWGSSPAC